MKAMQGDERGSPSYSAIQAAQIQGAAEQRSERIRRCVSEQRMAATTEMGCMGVEEPAKFLFQRPA